MEWEPLPEVQDAWEEYYANYDHPDYVIIIGTLDESMKEVHPNELNQTNISKQINLAYYGQRRIEFELLGKDQIEETLPKMRQIRYNNHNQTWTATHPDFQYVIKDKTLEEIPAEMLHLLQLPRVADVLEKISKEPNLQNKEEVMQLLEAYKRVEE